MSQDLGIQDNVEFILNADYDRLKKDFLGRASIGLHTMMDEHFGITVVEFMVRQDTTYYSIQRGLGNYRSLD